MTRKYDVSGEEPDMDRRIVEDENRVSKQTGKKKPLSRKIDDSWSL